jgi:type IV pilus assembly protein PilM
MPLMSEEDLKSAILFEAENYIPLPVNEVYLDCEIVSSVHTASKNLDVLLAAIPKRIVDPYLRVLKKAGLKPIAFEIESLSIARALIKDQKTTQPVLIIDLGATRSSFVIFSGNSVRFTCSIPISGIHFTELIAKNLKVSFEKAEKLKIIHGLREGLRIKLGEKTTLEKVKGKIFEALIPGLVDLVQQIKKYLDFYQAHAYLAGPEGKKIQKIILCGGGANLKGLDEFLELELKIPVEVGNPWINVGEVKNFPKENSLSFTTCNRLSLKRNMINLLPPEQIRELKEEENFKILLNIFFLILFFFISFFLILLSIRFYLSGILDSQKILLEKEEKILDFGKKDEIKKYNELLSKIDKFYQKRIPLFPKIESFFEKIPPEIYLKEIELKIDKKGEISFSLVGFSKTREGLLNLIKTLKENYKDVTFSPEILLKGAEIDFSISFKIK